MSVQPVSDLGCLVSCVVVHDQEPLLVRIRAINLTQKRAEVLTPVTRLHGPGYVARGALGTTPLLNFEISLMSTVRVWREYSQPVSIVILNA